MEIFLWAWLAFTTFLILVFFYQIAVSLAGFRDFKAAPVRGPKTRFAVIVPAHNEGRVIGKTLDSIFASRYPKELFKVIVIADNCSDDTTEIAFAKGAVVLERFDSFKRGKGQALKWAIARIREKERYDAYVVIDSDNILSRNYLNRMNNEILSGQSVMQGYLATKNPNDNYVTRTIFTTYAYINRFFELSRENLGLCCPLGGTGICLTEDIIDRYGWDYTTLTEDLELTARLALDGIKVRFVYDAKVFDEKPRTLYTALKQRQRWMAGHAAVLRKFQPRLIAKGIAKGELLALDAAFYLGIPLLMMLWAAMDAWRMIFHFNDRVWPGGGPVGEWLAYLNIFVFVGFAIWWIAIPLIALKIEGFRIRKYWYTSFLMMIMAWIMLALFVAGLFRWDQNRWWHTKHEASLDKGISLDD
jgi:cellulose synthase/poly-beta-1,6-N-acetylglucosamine synthase-like glycosyltransferase